MSVLLPRAVNVRNKNPAPLQLTAEHLLREARDFSDAADIRKLPVRIIADTEELEEYRAGKRNGFEDRIRRMGDKGNIRVWINYSEWEQSQREFKRVRSIFERALEAHIRNHTIWLKYAEFEMKNKFINHARNVWDRAVTHLPSVDQLWYKYIHMEEILGNIPGARQIFQRWIRSQPDQQKGWFSLIKFELRYNEIDKAREIFERFVLCYPKVSSWISFAKFEIKNGDFGRARDCYERAVDMLAESDDAEQLFVSFAEFEEHCKERERARCVYKFALDHFRKGGTENLFKKYLAFEKQFPHKEGLEDAIVVERRFEYEDEVKKKPLKIEMAFGKLKRQRQMETEDGPSRYVEMLKAARKLKKQKVYSDYD